MNNAVQDIVQNTLFSMADPAYKDFQSPLLPSVSRDRIIGVRMPMIRKYAKSIQNTSIATEFLKDLPHFYYEEQNLHALLIAEYEGKALFDALDAFLPYVDNWATCDSLRPQFFKKLQEQSARVALRAHIERWFSSSHLYARRFAIEMLMLHFLDQPYKEDLDRLAAAESDEYYEQMMIAWYFSEALCRHFDAVLPYFSDKKLKATVLKMAKRKAFDSFKLTRAQKELLK